MRYILLVSLWLVPLLCVVADEAKPLIWTRTADGRTIEATLVRYDATSGMLTLRSKDGQLHLLSVDLLIEEDRRRLPERASRPGATASRKDQVPQVASEAGKVVTSQKGRLESFTPEAGGGHLVHIYLPPGYVEGDPKSRSTPVLFLFSPGGNSRGMVDFARSTADKLGWVLIGVDAYRNTRSLEDRFEERMAHTRAAVKAAQARVVFDPKKIVFGGMSGGGWWSFQCAAEITREAAGILSCGGWMGEMYNKRYSPQMAVAMINGDKDKAALDWVGSDTTVLKSKANAKVQTFTFSGGHVFPPPEVFAEAARWVHQQKRF